MARQRVYCLYQGWIISYSSSKPEGLKTRAKKTKTTDNFDKFLHSTATSGSSLFYNKLSAAFDT